MSNKYLFGNNIGLTIGVLLVVFLCVFWLRCCTSGIAGISKKDMEKINAFRSIRGLDSIPLKKDRRP